MTFFPRLRFALISLRFCRKAPILGFLGPISAVGLSYRTFASEPDQMLKGEPDFYSGVTVKDTLLDLDADAFEKKLKYSLQEWKKRNVRGVWMKIPITKSELIPLAVNEGFFFHHAEKDYVMMTRWLPNTPNTLPQNASHQVGVGCIVVNDKSEILMVRERTGPTKTRAGKWWKYPTGIVNQGEDIWATAEREVLEETGIKSQFLSVIAFRQMHNLGFGNAGKSDLFFVCLLKPLSLTIKKQDDEIEECQWMPLQEFSKLGLYQPGSVYSILNHIALHTSESVSHLLSSTKEIGDLKEQLIPVPGFVARSLPIGFRPGDNYVYFPVNGISSAAAQELEKVFGVQKQSKL